MTYLLPKFGSVSFFCCCFVLLAFKHTYSCTDPNTAPQKPNTSPIIVHDSVPYNLSAPDYTINLVSEDLKEISGLSPTDSNDVYLGIADEKGEIYFVNTTKGGVITRKILFRTKGDFEGVELAQGDLYAAKSDGKIYQIERWQNPNRMESTEYETHLDKSDDVEGLCFDSDRNALLLACKGNPENDDSRKIYAFSLKSKKLGETPTYAIDPTQVEQIIPNGPDDKPNYFSPSGVAIHPLTKDVYVISTAKKALVVLDYKSGAIKFAQKIDKKIIPQPEGIAFDKSGNLLIGSEGKKGEGMILKFDLKR